MRFFRLCSFVAVPVAFLMVSTPGSAQMSTDRLFGFLMETYNQHDKKLLNLLVTELTEFSEAFPDSEQAAEATYLLAKVYEEKGDEDEAVAACYKTIYLYSDTTQRKASAELARQILAKEKRYGAKEEKLSSVLEREFSSGEKAALYYKYIDFLVELDEPKLYEWTLAEARRFVSRFPTSARLDTVLLWTADLYAKMDKAPEAVASYVKLDHTHPDSPLLPYAHCQRGVLLSDKLGKHEEAIAVLDHVASVYLESEFAPLSLFKIGEIKEGKLKDYEGAILAYRSLVDAYPQHKKVVEALWAIAEINSKKLKDYPAAVLAYDQIVTQHQSHSYGVRALEEIGNIYEDKIKDYAKAAEYYAKIAELYPFYDKAPELLLKAGSVCEDKLEDYEKAIEYYQQIIDKFPEHKKASEAEKRIERARKK